MNFNEIQLKIEKEIPITQNMGVQFLEFTKDSCHTSVPLAPNHNHKGTAFGGSLFSVCTATAYGLMYSLQIKEKIIDYDLVIGEGTIKYLKPVTADFEVRASIHFSDWEAMLKRIERSSFGKIKVRAQVFLPESRTVLCEYSGTFILMKPTLT